MAGSALVLDREHTLAPGCEGASALEARRLPRPVAASTVVGPSLDAAAASRVVGEATEEAMRLASKLEESGIVPPLCGVDVAEEVAASGAGTPGGRARERMSLLDPDEDSDLEDDGSDDRGSANAEVVPADVVDSYFRSCAHDAVYFMALRCCERLQEVRPDVTLEDVCFRLLRTLARAGTAIESQDAARSDASSSSSSVSLSASLSAEAPRSKPKPKPEMFGAEIECMACCVTWARSKAVAQHRAPRDALDVLEAMMRRFVSAEAPVQAYAVAAVLKQRSIAAAHAEPVKVLTSERAVTAVRKLIRGNAGAAATKLYNQSLHAERQAKEQRAYMMDGSRRPFYPALALELTAQEFARRIRRASSERLVQVCGVLRWQGVMDLFCGVAPDDVRGSYGVVSEVMWDIGAPIIPALRGMGLASYYYYFGDSRLRLRRGERKPEVDPLVLEWS